MIKAEIKMHRASSGNYVSEDGHFRAWRDGCVWYALDMRTSTILARKSTYSEIKQFLAEYAAREHWRRKQAFWRVVSRIIAEEDEA